MNCEDGGELAQKTVGMVGHSRRWWREWWGTRMDGGDGRGTCMDGGDGGGLTQKMVGMVGDSRGC